MNNAITSKLSRENNIGNGVFRTQLTPLLLISSIFLLNFTSRTILAPLLPAIEKDLGFSDSLEHSLFKSD